MKIEEFKDIPATLNIKNGVSKNGKPYSVIVATVGNEEFDLGFVSYRTLFLISRLNKPENK